MKRDNTDPMPTDVKPKEFTFSSEAIKEVLDLSEKLAVPQSVVIERALGLLKYAVDLKENNGRLIAETRWGP